MFYPQKRGLHTLFIEKHVLTKKKQNKEIDFWNTTLIDDSTYGPWVDLRFVGPLPLVNT